MVLYCAQVDDMLRAKYFFSMCTFLTQGFVIYVFVRGLFAFYEGKLQYSYVI